MRGFLRRSLTLVAAAATVAAWAGAAPAAAAPVFTRIGQFAPPSTANGGCLPCTAVQRTSDPAGATTYTFPYDGVLTRFSVSTGSSIATFGGEWVRARTFRVGDATHTRVVSESAQATLDPAMPSTTQTFWDRVPATAGDVLGAKFHTGPYILETPYVYTTTGVGDTAAITTGDPGPGVGEDAVGTAFPSLRVNISAHLEHDADHDGYGDGSQDLCLGDPVHATTACSGTLSGSNLQGPYQQLGFTCTGSGGPCARIQLTSGGASTSPAADGVIVRWRLQAPTPGVYHIVILEPAGGGSYRYARQSDTVTIGADEALWTFPARVAIKAGSYVALVPPPAAIVASSIPPPAGATWTTVSDLPLGSTTTLTLPGLPGAFLYDTDIERDADHDGYGDVTQDACPTDSTTHGACPHKPPPDGGTPTTATLTSFKARYSRFRVNRKGPVAGAVSSSRPHAGTTLKLKLSSAGTVRFTVKRLTTGVRSGGRCHARRPKHGDRRCTITKTVHSFSATLGAGAGAVAYSGRYRRAGHTRTLTVGTYRIQAAVISSTGVAGKARSVTVKVVR